MVGQTVARSAGTVLPGTVKANPPIFALKSNTPVPTYQTHNCSALDVDGSCGYGNAITFTR